MPLLSDCDATFQNPFGQAIPAAPNILLAPALAPNQGDHVFGDVLGTIETALQRIFGGGQVWPTRMENYSSLLSNVWTGLQAVDLGHGAAAPLVTRAGAAETDQHSHMFGGYSARLQWEMAEIVCTGFAPNGGGERRRIGGYKKSWKKAVLKRFDELMNNLVDSTAIAFYIATPNAIRNSNANTVHAPWSLAHAVQQVTPMNGPGKGTITPVLDRYDSLRNSIDGLIGRFELPTRSLNVNNNTWA